MGDIDDTDDYEKTSSDVLVEQQKAREKQAQDNEDRRQARQEAKVSQSLMVEIMLLMINLQLLKMMTMMMQ